MNKDCCAICKWFIKLSDTGPADGVCVYGLKYSKNSDKFHSNWCFSDYHCHDFVLADISKEEIEKILKEVFPEKKSITHRLKQFFKKIIRNK